MISYFWIITNLLACSLPSTAAINQAGQFLSKPNALFSAVDEDQRSVFGDSSWSTSSTPKPALVNLTFQACCGSVCSTFDSVMAMVGLECCGSKAVSHYDRICCQSKPFERRVGNKYYDRCCADKPYTYEETCCKGKVYAMQAQSCCGDEPFDIYDRSRICCGEKVHEIPQNVTTAACCDAQLYDAWGGSQFCCGSKVYSVSQFNSCCVKYNSSDANKPPRAEGYNTDTHQCCDGVYAKNYYDGCCYVYDAQSPKTKPPKPTPFNSKVQCCGITGIKNKNADGECPS